jgi:hypothetical protein
MLHHICLAAVLLSTTLAASPAFAQVPHTFKSGDPARASEVNENFSHLWKQMTSGRPHVHRHDLDPGSVTGHDANGNPYCALASTGGAYDPNAPFTVITTATVPDGQYLLVGKVDFHPGTDARNAWYVVECILRDSVYDGLLDFASFSGTAYSGSGGLPAGSTISTSTNFNTPLLLLAANGISTGSGGTVTISCRVQGQDRLWNGDGTFSTPHPITDVHITGAKISAVAVGSLIME